MPLEAALIRSFLAVVAILLTGCTFNPVGATFDLCPDCVALPLAVRQGPDLLAYHRNLEELDRRGFVHVYLEGDGQPWIRNRWPAANPTSREMVALRLMVLDPNPSIYINRLCYGYRETPAICDPTLWTNGRYSEQVVNALAESLQGLARRHPGKRWVLIGHSGGGALAILLAARLNDVAAVITVAANLDHQAWTASRGYSALDHSLNPAAEKPLPEAVIRWHFAGGLDKQVPPEITQGVAEKDPHARFRLQAEFGHNCCWQRMWPDIIRELDAQLTGTK